MKFYDREEELKVLENAYSRHESDMIVVNGRRRIGKSRLVDEFSKSKKSIRVIIVPKEEKQIAKDIEEEIRAKTGYSPSFDSFKEAMEYLFVNNTKFIFLDEFPNVLASSKSIPYELQRLWDMYKEQKEIMLVISGSYASMMEKITTRKRAPLFNRATATLNIGEMQFDTVVEILNDIGIKDPKEQISYYCVFGGVPYYYILLEKIVKSAFANAINVPFIAEDLKNLIFANAINVLFFDAGAQLHEEGENILRQEFGNAYAKYYAILEVIHSGHVTMNEISQNVGITQTTLAKYIKKLQTDYKFVYREVPFGQNPLRSKKGLYFIKDNMLSFWFSNVYGKSAVPTIEELNKFVSRRFEMLCRSILVKFLEKRGEQVLRSGKWWGNVEVSPGKFEQREIDVVVETEKVLYIGECKWSNSHINQNVLEHLKESAIALKKAGKELKFVLFSKNGVEFENEEGVLLFDSKAIVDV